MDTKQDSAQTACPLESKSRGSKLRRVSVTHRGAASHNTRRPGQYIHAQYTIHNTRGAIQGTCHGCRNGPVWPGWGRISKKVASASEGPPIRSSRGRVPGPPPPPPGSAPLPPAPPPPATVRLRPQPRLLQPSPGGPAMPSELRRRRAQSRERLRTQPSPVPQFVNSCERICGAEA